MSWRTHPVTIAARNKLRRLGLTLPLASLVSRGYEEPFGRGLIGSVVPGDCVWDVGANVGYYAVQLARCVGPRGYVFAFEPSPLNLSKLRQAAACFQTIHLVPKALGATNGTTRFIEGADQKGSTSRIVGTEVEHATLVPMVAGDSLISSGEVMAPNVVKIDVEGHELDVLEGMRATLLNQALRTVGVEVHFHLLSERGFSQAPAEIEMLLRKAGFHVRWTDDSHFIGSRG